MDTKVSVEEISEATRSLEFQIPHDEYKKRFDTLLNKTIPNVRIKGFRPGRAPRAIVAKMHGPALHRDVVTELINDAYRDAVTEHDLKVVGDPAIDLPEFNDGEDLKFSAKIDILPEPEIKDPFGLKFEAEIIDETITDDEIEEQIKGVAARFGGLEDVEDRDVTEEGDIITVDFKGTVDGEEFPGGAREGAVLEVGNSGQSKEFDAALVGLTKGKAEQKEMKLPDDLPDEGFSGKVALYEFSVSKIQQKVEAPIDDELAKKTGAAEDLEGLKKHVRESLEKQKQEANKAAREDALFKALAEKNPFEIPQALIDRQIREILFEMGMLDRRRQESYQVDVGQFREVLAEGAEMRVRRYLMLEQLVSQESIKVEDSEVDGWVEEMSKEQGAEPKDIKQAYGLPENNESIKDMLAQKKMTDMLLEKASIKEVAPKEEPEGESK